MIHKNMIKYLLFTLSLLLLTGCAQQIRQPTIEDYGLIGVIGIDVGDENKKIKLTAAWPQHAETAKKKIQIYTSLGNVPEEALLIISQMTELRLTLAELRTIIFSEEFAKKHGLFEAIEGFYRDPIVGDNVYIAIAKGKAEEMLRTEYPDKPDVTVLFRRLLQPRGETAFNPFTTIHDFIYYSTDDISDPHLPYIERTEKTIKLSKVALFKDRKMVDTISPPEAKLVEAILGRKELADMALDIFEKGEKKSTIVVNYVTSRSKIKSNGDMKNPKLTVKLDVQARVLDYTGKINLEDANQRKIVEHAFNDKLKKATEEVTTKLHKLGVDPLALGESFRSKYKGEWSKDLWKDTFGKAKISVEVNSEFVGYGTIK